MSTLDANLPDADTYAACRQLIERSAYYSDHQDLQAYAALFTPDGRLTRPSGDVLVGRAAIIESYRGRDPDRLVSHMVAQTVMSVAGQGQVKAVSTVLLWASSRSEPLGPSGRQAAARQLLGEYHDELVLTDEGWRIAQRNAFFTMYTE